jgi:hypothetical protein
MKITTSTLIVALVGIILIESVCFYSYWYDHEYPHGYRYVDLTNDTIEYYPDKYNYDDNFYVSFNGGQRYILGNGVKDKIENELLHWNKLFNTTNFLIEKPTPYPENTSYQFRLFYHTIDVPFECSSGSYKEEVLDDFELGSYGWSHN